MRMDAMAHFVNAMANGALALSDNMRAATQRHLTDAAAKMTEMNERDRALTGQVVEAQDMNKSLRDELDAANATNWDQVEHMRVMVDQRTHLNEQITTLTAEKAQSEMEHADQYRRLTGNFRSVSHMLELVKSEAQKLPGEEVEGNEWTIKGRIEETALLGAVSCRASPRAVYNTDTPLTPT